MLKDTRSLGKDSSDASIYRVAEAFRPTMGIDKSLLGKDAELIRTVFRGRVSQAEADKPWARYPYPSPRLSSRRDPWDWLKDQPLWEFVFSQEDLESCLTVDATLHLSHEEHEIHVHMLVELINPQSLSHDLKGLARCLKIINILSKTKVYLFWCRDWLEKR